MTGPKTLILDIERLPGLTTIFDQRTSGFIPVYKWRRLPSLLCFAAKWHGQRAVEFRAVWDDPNVMVQRAWELYDAADIVVTYNGRRFDNKHLRSEWAVAGLTPPSPWKDVDLFVTNKATFGFESKSLQHLCERLGMGGKTGHYDADEAEACIDGDETARRRMKRYNVGDVKITEAVYDRILPWISNHPNVNLFNPEGDGFGCPNCGSRNYKRSGKAPTLTRIYQRYLCHDCGKWFQGTRSIDGADVKSVAA